MSVSVGCFWPGAYITSCNGEDENKIMYLYTSFGA